MSLNENSTRKPMTQTSRWLRQIVRLMMLTIALTIVMPSSLTYAQNSTACKRATEIAARALTAADEANADAKKANARAKESEATRDDAIVQRESYRAQRDGARTERDQLAGSSAVFETQVRDLGAQHDADVKAVTLLEKSVDDLEAQRWIWVAVAVVVGGAAGGYVGVTLF